MLKGQDESGTLADAVAEAKKSRATSSEAGTEAASIGACSDMTSGILVVVSDE